jgi:ectoine hydroxylase-related dioxygenase (phytanoyl-CoA dioxygenase family)
MIGGRSLFFAENADGRGQMQLASSADGFCVLDGVLDAAGVTAMREHLTMALSLPEREGDGTSAFGRTVRQNLLRYPDVYRAVFTPRVIAALQHVAADWPGGHFVVTPEHSFHRDGFGNGIADWHKDTDAQERAGWNFHWYPGYAVVQCAIYLQDSSSAWGGGLSVIPGSHKVPNPFGMLQQPQLRESWYADKTMHVIPSKAGDLVCFDTKLDHYATAKPPGSTPPFGHKLAIFFSIAPRDQLSDLFATFLHARPDYGFLASYAIPDDVQAIAHANNFSFQT